MITQPIFRAAALAAFALFATATTSHAQGVGGMLNKAKAKAKQATQPTSSPAAAASQATQAAKATEYQLPPEMPEQPSTSEMEEYARALLADPRPVPKSEMGRDTPNEWYRRLTRNEGFPIKFTWDQAVLANFKKRRDKLMPQIEDLCNALATELEPDNERHVQFGKVLRKVKEIHLTAIPKPEIKGEPGEEHHWYFSYNPATQVLTAATASSDTMSGPTSFEGLGSPVPLWIMSHVR